MKLPDTGRRRRRAQLGDLGEEQVAGDTSPGQQHGGCGARLEFAAHQVEVIGTDLPVDLAAGLGEADQVPELIELENADVASGVLGDEDDVENADYSLVDQVGQLRSDLIANVPVRERQNEISWGSCHLASPRHLTVSA
jgi:hypothetical protein